MVARGFSLKAAFFYLFLGGSVFVFNGLAGCSNKPFERSAAEDASLVSGSLYRVQPGDTLWEISHGFGFSPAELAAHNSIEDASLLKISQQLHIPIPEESRRFLWPSLGSYSHSKELGGITLALQAGSWVRASRSGKVVLASDSLSSFGPTVIVDHDNSFHTVYAGLSDVRVKPGDFVLQGSTLGSIAYGPLYFEIRQEGETQDTLFLLPRL